MSLTSQTEPSQAVESLTLVIMWRTGPRTHARTVKIGGSVSAKLRDYAGKVSEGVADNAGLTYDPDQILEDAHHSIAPRGEAWDTELLTEIEKGSSLENAVAADFRRSLLGYALVVSTPGAQTIYVRKSNPVVLARKPFVAQLVDDTLSKIDKVLFAFDEWFDVVITSDQIVVLNQKNFELLFKESEAVLAKAPEWVAQLAAVLPFTPGSREVFADSLKTNSFYRQKLHSILRRPYVSELTPELLRERMSNHGLDVERLMPNGELNFTPENTKELLRLLNEDYFQGDFSHERFAASAKQRIGS
jgi:hypothetical protein